MKSLRLPIPNSTLLIAGTARNVGIHLQSEITHLLSAAKNFKAIHLLIVESDSSDDTLKVLEKLRVTIKNFSYLSLGSLSKSIASRTSRIAFCRNKIVEEVRCNPKYAEIDYVMIADLDGVNNLMSSKKIAQCWEVSEDWGAIFANQTEQYYDIYALRHPQWNSGDCLANQKILSPILGPSLSHHLCVSSKQVALPNKLGLIKVDSAFGGFGIYKRAAFISGNYVGEQDGHDICEHVPFHREIRAKGFNFYINCALINCNKPSAPNSDLKKRRFLVAIRTAGRIILGKPRFDKYLEFLKS